MKKLILALLCILIFDVYVFCEPAAETMAAFEKRFAQTSVEKGIKDSFVAFLAEDSIIFRPHAVAGKKWMQEHPATPGVLNWTPMYAEVSASGDYGFTTGPWEFRKSAAEDPVGYGQFLSVWKKQPNGEWKVILDCGIEYEKPSSTQLLLKTEYGATGKAASSKGTDAALLEVDRSIQSLTALGRAISDRSFLLRAGSLPVRGKEAIDPFLKQSHGSWTFQHEKANVSPAGDLGYTYGTYEHKDDARTERGVYVRIWRIEDDWKIAADVLMPDQQ